MVDPSGLLSTIIPKSIQSIPNPPVSKYVPELLNSSKVASQIPFSTETSATLFRVGLVT